ncbi:MAG TPA: hypothetical protein VK625_00245 [Flavitalea sp.]|nr:hypothetical protein [Flavitalea sp.]
MTREYFKFIVVLLLTANAVPANGQHISSQPPVIARRAVLNSFNAWRTSHYQDRPADTASGILPLWVTSYELPVTGAGNSVSAVRKDLYTKNFGFFCRKEWQIEKSTRIPFRLRLGSLEQCNILEQKN